MGNNETRLAATCGIWLAFTAVTVAALVTRVFDGSGTLFLVGFIFLLIAVSSATQAVWKYGGDLRSGEKMTEKAKRHSRVTRMLDKLDEDDLAELRARLMSESDGEAVSLEELLAERKKQNGE